MKKSSYLVAGALAVALVAAAGYYTYNHFRKHVADPAFKAYITAYTSGTISRESNIRIRLAVDAVKESELNTAVPQSLFDFSPSVKGNAFWVDTRTIEFRPGEKLKSGQQYNASFALGKVMKVPAHFSEFEFSFQVTPQSFDVQVEGLRPLSNQHFDRQFLLGTLSTADVEDADKVEKVLAATQNGRKLPIRWSHQPDRMVHSFTVDSIMRGKDSSAVILSWDGAAIDVNLKGEKSVYVPAIGDFILLDTRVVQDQTDQYLLLTFSDPLLETQNLHGLITLDGKDEKMVIDANTVRVYPSERLSGKVMLYIAQPVQNGLGKKLKNEIRQEVLFEELKPALRLVGKGVILPSSNGLIFPFEAVSLNAVDVRIVKIYENNIAQFLQVNSLEGDNELVRVGRVVLQKTIPLSSLKKADQRHWNQYALDLSEMIKVDPGAIYKVTIAFRKKYSVYACTEPDTSRAANDDDQEMPEGNWDDMKDPYEASNWDYVQQFYEEGEEGEGYNYNNRDNPCKREYYNSGHWITRNILASDLGLLAKRGAEGSMLFTVTDLKTTDPVAGTTLEIYNLQQQLLQKVETNGDGMAEVSLKQKPFLIIARKGEQRGYLKVDDGSALSLSMFDVSGETVQKGIKGFIYGERGVWRPGDSIYLMFIMEDKQRTMPESYPVAFELFNPRGQLTKKIIRSESLNGFYTFATCTDPDAPTGTWEARVRVGNAKFSKNIRIETVMPNRLKIKLDFDKKYLAKGESDFGKMEVHWLTGIIARGLKANVEVALTSGNTTFPKYKDYIFDDPTRKFSADKQVIFDNVLDENGKASVPCYLNVSDVAPGQLTANFVTKVFEPGGNFSTDRFSMPYHPYNIYTGIHIPPGDKARGMLLTDTNHLVRIVSVDKDGNPVQGKRRVQIEFYKVQWRWWWDKSDEDNSDYNSRSYNEQVSTQVIETNNGLGTYVLRLAYPNWGRYMIKATDLESGHSTGKAFYMDWPGWAGRSQKDQGAGGATMLTFAADKDKYTVGEQVNLTIPSGQGGRALITVESGTKVLKSWWLETRPGQSMFKFPVTGDMAPNVYVSVTLLQPHAQTVNDLPIRMYGVIPIMIENPQTHLKPVIKMADVLKPGEKVNINVSEEKGKPMTFTLAVVDEGLLDLTRFETPNPWDAFYAREALGVKTWDMFDFVIGAWGSKLERVLAIGGDEGINKPKDGKKANRFKPVVKFLGPYHLGGGDNKTVSFVMPEYIGSVRTMVVAGEDGAYGMADKATPVRKPLMVLATLPRVLGPEEKVDLPITVFAMEKQVKEVTVQIQANDLFEVDGPASRSIKFGEPGDDVLNFKLKVKPMLGLAKVKVIATSGKERAETSIELDVRNPNPRITMVVDTVLNPGQTWNTTFSPVGIAGTNKIIMEMSSVPPLNLGTRLEYLIHYPYGCVEQTTSSVFPQLYLSDLLELPSERKAEMERNIKAGINRLRIFQVSSGGLTYWPGDGEENSWATNYAGHFMIEAELKGYTLPPGFLDQWKKYQHIKASTWSGSNDNACLTQAYRLYTLALAKSPDMGSMNRLKETRNLPAIAKWSLAEAYQLAGQPEVAAQLINSLPMTVKPYREMDETFGCDERDKAIMLEALSLMNKREKAMPLVRDLSAALCSTQWMSTQATAYSLMAMSKYVGKAGTKSNMDFNYMVNGSSQHINTLSAVKQVDLKANAGDRNPAVVKNNGQGLLYIRIISSGIPKPGDEKSAQSNLGMIVSYHGLKGEALDPANITQGSDFYAEVSVTNPGLRGNYKQMALSQIFPSGWEILTSRLDQSDANDKLSTPQYQDIRDDRVYTYFDLKQYETKTFRIYLNATYQGSYYLPTVQAEAMYDASISARQAGQWITIAREGSAVSSNE